MWRSDVTKTVVVLGLALSAGLAWANPSDVRLARTVMPTSAKCCLHPEFHVEPSSRDYEVSVAGQSAEVRWSRESRIPFNRSWPGYQRSIDQTELASYVAFEGGGTVDVRVRPQRAFTNVVVRPLSTGVRPTVEGGVVSLTLPRPGYYVVEVDGSHKALQLFFEPSRDFSERASATRIFGPGIHIVGNVDLKSHDRVYVDRDAIVYGCFTARDCEDIRIFGHGVLNGRGTERIFRCCYFEQQRSTLRFDRCRDVLVDGPVVMDSPNWSIQVIDCENLAIRHVKVVGQWRYNTDGIDVCNSRHVKISDSYVRSFDDTISIKGLNEFADRSVEDIEVSGCVLWCGWGKTIEPGIETWASAYRNLAFRDCDLIHNAAWAINVSAGGSARVEDVLFENLRVELQSDTLPMIGQESDAMAYEPGDRRAPPRLLKFDNQKYAVRLSEDRRMGALRNVVARDIRVLTDGKVGKPQLKIRSVAGDDGAGAEFSGVRLERFTIDGRPAGLEDFDVDSNVGFDFAEKKDE